MLERVECQGKASFGSKIIDNFTPTKGEEKYGQGN